MTMYCKICTSPFEGRANARYCGPKCARIGRNKTRKLKRLDRYYDNLETRQCCMCDKSFRTRSSSRRKYCGPVCRNHSRYSEPGEPPKVVNTTVYFQDEWLVPARPMSRIEKEILREPSICHRCKHMETCRQVVTRLQVDPFYNGEIRCMVRI